MKGGEKDKRRLGEELPGRGQIGQYLRLYQRR